MEKTENKYSKQRRACGVGSAPPDVWFCVSGECTGVSAAYSWTFPRMTLVIWRREHREENGKLYDLAAWSSQRMLFYPKPKLWPIILDSRY